MILQTQEVAKKQNLKTKGALPVSNSSQSSSLIPGHGLTRPPGSWLGLKDSPTPWYSAGLLEVSPEAPFRRFT